MTKQEALELLQLNETFTYSELEFAFSKGKDECNRGMENAINNEIRDAYQTTLNSLLTAFQVLIPYAKSGNIEGLKEEINTPSNIKVEPAGFWLRLLAYSLDYVFLLIINGIIRLIIPINISRIIWPVNVIIIPWIYFAISESSTIRASFGKQLVGLMVVNSKYGKITFAQASIRYFSKFLSFLLLFMGFIIIGTTKTKQGLHDIIAKTVVLKSKDDTYRKKKIFLYAINTVIILFELNRILFAFPQFRSFHAYNLIGANALHVILKAESIHGIMGAESIHGVYTAQDIHGVYTAEDIYGVYEPSEIHGVYSAEDIHGVFTPEDIYGVYTAEDIHGVYTADDIHGTYTAEDIHGVFSAEDIHGLYTLDEIKHVYRIEDVYGVYSEEEIIEAYTRKEIRDYNRQYSSNKMRY